MLLACALFVIGFALLIYGADRLVFSSALLCRSLGIPPLIIGITVVGIGTSLPELIIAFSAAAQGQMDIAVGTALGANIANILLILGSAALLHPLTVHSNRVRRELPLMLLITLLCGIVLFDNQLSRKEGIALLVIAALWFLFIIRHTRRDGLGNSDSFTQEQLAELPRADVGNTVAFLWLAVALIMLPMSTHMVIDNATLIAHDLGMHDLTAGLTLIAIGASLPALATVIASVVKGEDDIAVGHLIGANIYNIVIVLGLPALIYPGRIEPRAFACDYWIMLGASALFMLICLRRRGIGRAVGGMLLCGFIAWVTTLLMRPFGING